VTSPQDELEITPGWPPPPKHWSLRENELHVWAASLDVNDAQLNRFAVNLSSLEAGRASRFHFPRHRDRFIAGRGFLRAVLGHYLRTEPGTLEFSYGAQGKPALAGVHARNGLHFNLAHSEDLVLLAVTHANSVGVDVERVRTLRDPEELVARFFSPRESAAFRKVSPDRKPAAFFNLWTRKESWLKATGEGIGGSLHLVEVSFLPGEPARFLNLPVPVTEKKSWALYDLRPAHGFVGALAIAATDVRLQCWRWGGG
jgi:4'-phosphopantetheinyl transferase